MEDNKKKKKSGEVKVYKSNPIIDMKNEMTLTQQRMFNLYLALINPLNEKTKYVRFPLKYFVMAIGITEISAKKLRQIGKKAMEIYFDLNTLEVDEGGRKYRGMEMRLRHLWENFDVVQDPNGEWYVELLASEAILPYLFDLRDIGYVHFSLIRSLKLRSPTAEKLYEQCMRFRPKGDGEKTFMMSVDHLKERLGVDGKPAYLEYGRFKDRVLKRCIEQINNTTDIFVSIQEDRMRKRGAPVKNVVFSVKKNPDYKQSPEDKLIERLFSGDKIDDIDSNSLDIEIKNDIVPISVSADHQSSMADAEQALEAYSLCERLGVSDTEAEAILLDKKRYSVSDEEMEEIIKRVDIDLRDGKIKTTTVAYARFCVQNKDVILKKKGVAYERNPFNQFQQNEYDFDELEKVLLSNGDAGDADEGAPAHIQEVGVKEETLPPYYIVIGDPHMAERLAAYATLGVVDNIKVLTPEEHERLSKTGKK